MTLSNVQKLQQELLAKQAEITREAAQSVQEEVERLFREHPDILDLSWAVSTEPHNDENLGEGIHGLNENALERHNHFDDRPGEPEISWSYDRVYNDAPSRLSALEAILYAAGEKALANDWDPSVYSGCTNEMVYYLREPDGSITHGVTTDGIDY